MENKSIPPNDLDSKNDDAGKAEHQILSYPALIIDYAICDKYLKDWDATPEQKQEFADTLWQIIVAFVDLGFGVHPAQQALKETGGQNEETETDLTSDLADVLQYIDYPKPETLQVTKAFNRDEEEGVET